MPEKPGEADKREIADVTETPGKSATEVNTGTDKTETGKSATETKATDIAVPDKPYEEMTVEELQAAIPQKMANNGPVTDDMKRSVSENVWHDSLLNWVKSFR